MQVSACSVTNDQKFSHHLLTDKEEVGATVKWLINRNLGAEVKNEVKVYYDGKFSKRCACHLYFIQNTSITPTLQFRL